jgi:hypothetical protein
MEFFCSRCGARLQVSDDMANARVKCGQCGRATRTPDAAEQLPVATVLSAGGFYVEDDGDGPIDEDEAVRALLAAHADAVPPGPAVDPPADDAADELARALHEARGQVPEAS